MAPRRARARAEYGDRLTRRITQLFRPYRGRLVTVLLLIAVSASLGMVSPFLLRDIPVTDDLLESV